MSGCHRTLIFFSHWVTTQTTTMPSITPYLGARDTVPQPGDGKDNTSSAAAATSDSVVWIVVCVVAGVIFLGSAIALGLMFYSKHRQQKREQGLRPYYLPRHQAGKRRGMSASDLFREEEERRRQIIRKSLATRSSYAASSGAISQSTLDQTDRELVEMERRESARLKDDWKRWEARVHHERSVSGEQHPAASAASNQVPIIAIPSPAKHRSQGRMSLTCPATPPVPPRHPGRSSSSWTPTWTPT